MLTLVSPKRDATAQFLAATAHELRLPLSHIKGFVTSLLRTDVDWDDATRNEFIEQIDQETDRLSELLETLLGTGASNDCEQTSVKRELTAVADVVHGALQRTRGVILDRSVRVDLPFDLPLVYIDGAQIDRALANLIENAVKYSPPGSPIGISACFTRSNELAVSVEDEGPGVAVEDRERIFQPFFRTSSAAESNIPGHGLGLAISACIVNGHGGSIFVTDRPGGGSRFHVVLPMPGRRDYFGVTTGLGNIA